MQANLISVVAIAIFHEPSGSYFLARRNKEQSGAGYWEFPGGKVEDNETSKLALKREIQEELSFDIDVEFLSLISQHFYSYPNRDIHISLYLYEVKDKPIFNLSDHDESCWVRPESFEQYKISQADRPFIDLLLSQSQANSLK